MGVLRITEIKVSLQPPVLPARFVSLHFVSVIPIFVICCILCVSICGCACVGILGVDGFLEMDEIRRMRRAGFFVLVSRHAYRLYR